MAARFYAPQPGTLVAVTGTNGKTSVTVFARQIWQRLNKCAASLGTIGIIGNGIYRPGSLTTPDPVTLHRELKALKMAGVDHVALEASSHGLDQFRLDGLTLAAAAFTNLTRDHLDYHRDMERYFTAKARLFKELLPPGGGAILNIDGEAGRKLADIARARGQRVMTYGIADRAQARLLFAEALPSGQRLAIEVLGERRDFVLPLIGTFQAGNVLAALCLVLATGSEVGPALDALPHLEGVPGRMQHVADHRDGAPVIVDYAHTPDALQTALIALRPHCRGRLIVVFGCGGDRDAGKRPQMGEIAERLADRVFITDDNPRSESPAAIRRAILAACPKAQEIGDREAAIAEALRTLGPQDLLLLAGKGHERGQILAHEVLPFDDAEVARRLAGVR